MNEAIIGIDLNEEEILYLRDHGRGRQRLHLASATGPENARVYTFAMCTGGVECPF